MQTFSRKRLITWRRSLLCKKDHRITGLWKSVSSHKKENWSSNRNISNCSKPTKNYNWSIIKFHINWRKKWQSWKKRLNLSNDLFLSLKKERCIVPGLGSVRIKRSTSRQLKRGFKLKWNYKSWKNINHKANLKRMKTKSSKSNFRTCMDLFINVNAWGFKLNLKLPTMLTIKVNLHLSLPQRRLL